MRSRHVSSWFHFHFRHWNINILEYYIFKTLWQIGNSITNLFIPIYLISDLKYTLWQVTFFYVLWQIGFPLAVATNGKVVERIGLKKCMALALPFSALFFLGVSQLSGDFVWDLRILIPIFILRTFFQSLANVSDDLFLAKQVLKKSPGRMLAWLKIVLTVATLIAPLVGGFVTYLFGFDALFYIAIGLILASGIPLLLTSDIHFKVHYKPKSVVSFFRKKVPTNYLIAEVGNVFSDTVMWILWPIFLFIALENTAEIGLLVTASAVVSIFISYFVGKYVDKFDPKKMILWGVRSISICFFARPLFLHPVVIATTDALNKIIDPIFRIPYDKARYNMISANKDFTKQATVKQFIQEVYYTSSVIILFLITLVYSKPSKKFFIVFFLISAATMLFMQRMASVHFRRRDRKTISKEEQNGVVEEILEQ